MGKRRSEEEIIKILKAAEQGIPIRDVIREHNVSEQSFYRWRQKYGGMETSEVRRLKDLERENSELKTPTTVTTGGMMSPSLLQWTDFGRQIRAGSSLAISIIVLFLSLN